MDTKKILELFNSAMDYKNKGDYNRSVVLYNEVLKIYDKLPEVYFNLAFVYSYLDEQEKANKTLEKFLELEPDDVDAKYFLSTFYFKSKDYEKGYELFENRISKKHAIDTQMKLFSDRFLSIPFWQGEDITDKTVYVYYEAGLGDTLMYFRYIELLAQKCKKVYVKPQMTLVPLFAENIGKAKILNRLTKEKSEEIDYQCPIMSLPYLLKLNNETIFYAKDKFLKSTTKKAQWYKERYFNNNKLKIGIKWQGNTLIGAERAMTAESFKEIFTIPNSQIYSIQVMDGANQVDKIKQYNVIDLGPTFKNFSDTAGAMENLDIVICNDTSVAHLAGAMGKICYCILPTIYDWRWHMDISKCDWYDSIKLFRQKTTWEEVLHRVYEDIKKDEKKI